MMLRVECKEVNGWPMMFCLQPVPCHTDKVRLANYGITRYNELKTICDKQREYTKLAKEGKLHRVNTTFTGIILEALLGKPLDEYIEEKVQERLKYLQEKKNDDN